MDIRLVLKKFTYQKVLETRPALNQPIMEPGMTFTVEPIVSEGSEKLIILEDGWTAISADNSRSAQAEHTVLITDTGIDILTV